MVLPQVSQGDPHVDAHNNERTAINALQDLTDPDFKTALTATIETVSGAQVFDGTAYTTAPGAKVFIGPENPGNAPDGSQWIKVAQATDPTDPTEPGGGTVDWSTIPKLGAGIRASSTNVGFLGNTADLTVLNSGDSLVGTVFEGTATYWDASGDALIVRGDNLLIEGYRINAAVIHSSGVDLTIRHSIIQAPIGVFFAVANNGPENGVFTITDSTVICDFDVNINPQPAACAISIDGRAVLRRCDISGSDDGVQLTGFEGSGFADGTIISQCYTHDLSYPNPAVSHTDYFQFYNSNTGYNTDGGQTYVTIEHCATDIVTASTGEAVNATITAGRSPTDPNKDAGPWLSLKIDNCLIPSGGFHLRLNRHLNNCHVTNNDFGYLYPAAGEFGLSVVDAETEATLTWTGNVSGDGSPYLPNDSGPIAP